MFQAARRNGFASIVPVNASSIKLARPPSDQDQVGDYDGLALTRSYPSVTAGSVNFRTIVDGQRVTQSPNEVGKFSLAVCNPIEMRVDRCHSMGKPMIRDSPRI